MTTHEQYHEVRKVSAMARWKRAWELRQKGYTYATIGAMLNVSLWTANKIINKYESHLLK